MEPDMIIHEFIPGVIDDSHLIPNKWFYIRIILIVVFLIALVLFYWFNRKYEKEKENYQK